MVFGAAAADGAVGYDIRGEAVDFGAPAGVVAQGLGAIADGVLGEGQGHAVVAGLQRDKLVEAALDDVSRAPEDAGFCGTAEALPDAGVEAGAGGFDSGVNFSGTAAGYGGDIFARGGVKNLDHAVDQDVLGLF